MNKDYLLLYGSIAHFSFAITFLSMLTRKNTYRLFLTCGHFLISSCFILRFMEKDDSEESIEDVGDYNSNRIFPYIGIIGHSIICIFFIATTIIENMNYRVVSSNILINLLCILGQIGMIIHYVTIKFDKEDDNINTIINSVTCSILFIFYLAVTLQQKNKDRILIPPLFMICLLYLGFALRKLFYLAGVKNCII